VCARTNPASLRRIAREPDETYESISQDIDEASWNTPPPSNVSRRHLARFVSRSSRNFEFLTFGFDGGSTPTYLADWRPEDPLSAVLSTCPSLLAVVKVGSSEIIQFSHISMKEFLISTRLAEAKDIISRYHASCFHDTCPYHHDASLPRHSATLG
jgi:hypothetical protein